MPELVQHGQWQDNKARVKQDLYIGCVGAIG